jgi:hypothetical protein
MCRKHDMIHEYVYHMKFIHIITHGHLSCRPIPMSIYPPPVISPGKSTRSSNERSSGKPLRTKRSRRSYRARSKLILGLRCEIDVFGFESKTGVVWCGMVRWIRYDSIQRMGRQVWIRFHIFHPLNWTSCRTNFWGTTPRLLDIVERKISRTTAKQMGLKTRVSRKISHIPHNHA